MNNQDTQQFAKFFIKDNKTKIPTYHSDKTIVDKLKISSTSN